MKKTLLFLVFISCSYFASGQTDLKTYEDNELKRSSNNPDKIFNHLNGEDSVTIEKVYLHLDRDRYIPGDDIWFKAYLIDASERMLTDNSYNLHVELISPESKIIDSRIVRLSDGLGNGDFHLKENLSSGRYRLRAYTNYMRNFDEKLFFSREIMIVQSSDFARTVPDSTDYINNNLEISFFPEGGSLVDSVTSIIAFKAVNANGTGCDVTGKIYSSTGGLVTTFKSTHKGMGIFSISPGRGVNYYAEVKDRYGNVVKNEIPKSFPTGIVLNISKNQPDELHVNFRTNVETLPLFSDKDLTLTVSARNTAHKTITFRMKTINSYLTVPTDDLPDGIIMLTLTATDEMPLCERMVYIQNNEEVKVEVAPDKSVYNQRDSVSLNISLSGKTELPEEAYLSLSAFDDIAEDNSSPFHSTISSWFLLESDVRGDVEEPSYYFDLSNPDRLKDLDLLLLTQGWRDFKWKYNTLNYMPENGFTISGRVRKKFADIPLKNSRVDIGIFKSGKPAIIIVPNDTSGKFCLKGVDLTGNAKLIVSAISEKEKLQGWVLLDSAKYISAKVPDYIPQKKLLLNNNQLVPDTESIPDNQQVKGNLNQFIQYTEVKKSISKKYKLTDTIYPGDVTVIAKRVDAPASARERSRRYLMATPDKEIVIDPQAETQRDPIQLLISKMVLSPRSRPLPGAAQSHSMQNPLYMIDGFKVPKSVAQSLPVSFIERIDVLNNMASYAIFGDHAIFEPGDTAKTPMDGVISIITRSDYNRPDYSPAFHSVNLRISGYDEPRIFYSPKHHTKLESDYKPDLRTTLFWEPNVKLEHNKDLYLNYYNADNPSFVKIIVEGITSNGIPVTGKAEYEVK